MIKRITIVALLIAFLSTEADAQFRKHRRRGAILGGLAGAAIGAAIGDKGDNETAGALIGGAVGAIAGGTIGNQKDQRIEHNMRYHSRYRSPYPGQVIYDQGHPHGSGGSVPQYYQPRVYQQQPLPHEPGPVVLSPPPPSILADDSEPQPSDFVEPAPTSRGIPMVTKSDVLKMVESGMSDAIIIRQIEIHGMAKALSVPEVIDLHKAGLSEQLITAMQLAAPEAANKMTIEVDPSDLSEPLTPPSYNDGVLPPPPPKPDAP